MNHAPGQHDNHGQHSAVGNTPDQYIDTIYACPMHPHITSNLPGRCPECGMELVPTKKKQQDTHETKSSAHQIHEGHSEHMFKNKFWVSLALSIVVVIYSDILRILFGVTAPAFPGSEYIPLVFGSIVFFYGGWIFLISATRELKARRPGMMTLISMAIIVAYVYSLYALVFDRGEGLFWELTTLVTIMLLGHWIEMRAVQGAQGALKELAKLLPDVAEVIRGNVSQIIPLDQLKLNDIVLVKPGGKIAADGEIIEGKSEVNESMITGESKPVDKQVGSRVIAGTINGDGSLKINVDKIGDQTFLSGVMRLVAQAQSSKSKLQMLSDQAAFYLTLIALVSGVLTLSIWLAVTGDANFALERTVAVLVIACPHALGLAIPLVASISTSMGAKNGLLVKQRLALEAARHIDVVLFDKTGTLTKGEYGIAAMIHAQQASEQRLLELAASVNQHSEHPIAQALLNEAKKRNMRIPEATNFQRVPGKGVKATVNGQEIFVGSESFYHDAGLDSQRNNTSTQQIDTFEKQGKTIIYVFTKNEYVGVIALADMIREESREGIAALKKLGVKVAMITGDSEDVAQWVATDLGIDEYFAKVLPEQKASRVKMLQDKGMKVAMVGDGVNDAPALTQADLGIAIGAGTNVAIESAGIILVKDDPRDIAKIVRLSRLTYRKMIQNLFWATGYNVIALPLAAGVLAFKGIYLQPALAAVFMSFSTLIVAFNAVLLKKNKL